MIIKFGIDSLYPNTLYINDIYVYQYTIGKISYCTIINCTYSITIKLIDYIIIS